MRGHGAPRRWLLVGGLLFVFGMGAAVSSEQTPTPAATAPTTKTTFLIVVRPGTAFLVGKPLSQQNLKEHGRYILSLHVKGKLKMAGGFLDDSGGAYVIEAADSAEANAIAAADPAVVAQIFVAEVRPWRLVDWAELAKRVQAP